MKRLYTKSSLLLIVLSLFISGKSFSQASLYFPYTFSTSANSTTLPTTNAMLATQDEAMAVITPGFNFPCGGRTYSNFLISSNGWVALLPSAAIPPYFATPLPNNDLAGYAGGTPLIAAMWDDIYVQNVNWNIVGTNLLIRWNARIPKNSTGAHLLGVILSSTTGSITFVYPNLASYNMNGNLINSASIGFASGCGEFYSVTPSSATAATSSDLAEFTGVLTQANPLPTITGTAGNTTINVSSTAGIVPGMYIGGTGVSVTGNVVGSVGAGLVNATVNNTAVL
nr:hypothetical protein [Bacteroidia bacterium]